MNESRFESLVPYCGDAFINSVPINLYSTSNDAPI